MLHHSVPQSELTETRLVHKRKGGWKKRTPFKSIVTAFWRKRQAPMGRVFRGGSHTGHPKKNGSCTLTIRMPESDVPGGGRGEVNKQKKNLI